MLTSRFSLAAARSLIESFNTSNVFLLFANRTKGLTYDLLNITETETVAQLEKVCQAWAAKRITAVNAALVARRYNWVAGSSFRAWSSSDATQYSGSSSAVPWYCINASNYNVYLCTGSTSSSVVWAAPTGTSVTASQATADGFAWKYLYTVPDSMRDKHLTSSYLPVPTLNSNPGTTAETYSQWLVQENARSSSLLYGADAACSINATAVSIHTFVRSEIDSGVIGCLGLAVNPSQFVSSSSSIPATLSVYNRNCLGAVVATGTVHGSTSYVRDSVSSSIVAYVHSHTDNYPTAGFRTLWLADRVGAFTVGMSLTTYPGNASGATVTQLITPTLSLQNNHIAYFDVATAITHSNTGLTEFRFVSRMQ